MQLLNESGEAEDLFTIYRNQNIHLSLKEFLEHMLKNWKSDPIFEESQLGSNCIVHTVSKRMQVKGCMESLNLMPGDCFFSISWIDSDVKLWTTLEAFFNPEDPRSILIFHFDKLNLNLKRLLVLQEYVRMCR